MKMTGKSAVLVLVAMVAVLCMAFFAPWVTANATEETVYTVTFKDWDGEVIASQTYQYGDTVTVPSDPTREAYVFTGWDKEIAAQCTGNAEYIAQYRKEQAQFSANFKGPEIVRAGDSITLTLSIDGEEYLGVEGVLTYDPATVELKQAAAVTAAPWTEQWFGNRFVLSHGEAGISVSGKKDLITATFQVKNLVPGAELKISVTELKVTTSDSESGLMDTDYAVSISEPKSHVNTLSSLRVTNADISPVFRSDITAYTASVPYSVSKLNLTYQTTHSGAKVKINNPTLIVGGTTKITITVTAENSSVKIYTISVKRAADPNHTASSNNNLAGIRVGGFLLSPVFSQDCTNYIVWLPYETDRVAVTGMAEDVKASVRVEGGTGLTAGADNEIKVICTAENGEEKVYTIIAKRAAAHGASTTQPTVPSTQPTQPAQPSEPAAHVCPPSTNIPVAMVIIPWALTVVAFAALLCVLIVGHRKKD